MEKEGRGRGENFVNKKRLNIVARSVAAISIAAAGAAAGAAAAEKSGLFDPLDSVDSANHLVLNKLNGAYDQLIDKLPGVEKAEAAPADASYVNPSTNPWIPDRNCNPELIDFTPHSAIMHVGDPSLTFTVDACLQQDFGIFVRLVEVDTLSDDNLDSLSVSSFDGINGRSVAITFHLDCVDGGFGLPNKLVGAGGPLHTNSYSQDPGGSAQLAIEMDYNVYDGTNYYDNRGPDQDEALISCLDLPPTPTPCPGGSGSGAGDREGNAAGTGSCSVSVGGIAELPDVEAIPQNMNSEKSRDYTTPIAGGIVATLAAVAATGAAMYIRKSRSAR